MWLPDGVHWQKPDVSKVRYQEFAVVRPTRWEQASVPVNKQLFLAGVVEPCFEDVVVCSRHL